MISTPHCQTATLLIEGAVTTGAHIAKACAEVEISERTLRRWTKGDQVHADQRLLVQRSEPRNKLSDDERAAVLSICNSTEFSSPPPSQIVPKLADQGHYLASESSFTASCAHRVSNIIVVGPSRPPGARPPTSYKASAPCHVSLSRIRADCLQSGLY